MNAECSKADSDPKQFLFDGVKIVEADSGGGHTTSRLSSMPLNYTLKTG